MGDKRDYPEGIPGSRTGGPTGIPGADGSPAEPKRSIYRPLDGSRPSPTPPQGPAWPEFKPGQYAAPGAATPQPSSPPQPSDGPPQTLAEQLAEQRAQGRRAFVLASWGQRLWATILDGIIIAAVLLCITVPIGVALGLTVSDAFLHFTYTGYGLESIADPAALQAVLLAQLVAQPLILSYLLARNHGQTPGKKLARIRVVRADGADLSLGDAVRRELLLKTLLVGGLTVITFGVAFLLNYLYPLWDEQRRAGHDLAAKTRVVRAGEPDEPS